MMAKREKVAKPVSFEGFAALVDGAKIIFVPRPRLIDDGGDLREVNCPATLIVHGEVGGKFVWYKKPIKRKAKR